MNQQIYIEHLENENRRLKAQLAQLDIQPQETEDNGLPTELEHLETFGSNIHNGCLFRFQIESEVLEKMKSTEQWFQHFHFMFVSPSWEQISNTRRAEEMQNFRVVIDKIHPDDRAKIRSEMYRCLTECLLFHAEFRFCYSETEIRWMQMSTHPRRTGSLLVCDGLILDITESRQNEFLLRAEKQRYIDLTNNIPDGVPFELIFDTWTNKAQIVNLSNTWEELMGVLPDITSGDLENAFAAVHPDSLPLLIQKVMESAKTLRPFNFETRLAGEETGWISIVARPHIEEKLVVWYGIIFDISERKQNEFELYAYRDNLELLVNERAAELEGLNEELNATNEELNATNEELYATNEEITAINEELSHKNKLLDDEMKARAKVMKQLDFSEKKMRSFIEQFYEGILIFNHEGRVTEWNRAMEGLTGMKREDAIGKCEWDLQWAFLPEEKRTPHELYDLHRKRIRYMLGDSPPEISDHAIQSLDGTDRHVLTTTFQVKHAGEEFYGRFVQDITLQRQTDMELSRYQSNLEQMVEEKTSEVVAKQKHLEALSRRQNVLINVLQTVRTVEKLPDAINPSLAEIGKYFDVSRVYIMEKSNDGSAASRTYEWCNTGIEPAIHTEQNIPMSLAQRWFNFLYSDHLFYVSDARTLDVETSNLLQEQGTTATVAVPLTIRDEHYGLLGLDDCTSCNRKWDMEDVNLLKNLSQIISSATQRHQAEASLQLSQNTMLTVLDNVESIIIVIDFDTMKILFANKATQLWSGKPNVEGMECWKTLQKDKTGICDFCSRAHVRDSNDRPTGIHYWEQFNDFTERWYSMVSTAIEWVDGRLVFMQLATDITNQKQFEHELIRARDKAEESDRLKASFLANISHEIRTPLNGIAGLLNILSRDPQLPETIREHIDNIDANSNRLIRLINDIIDAAQLETGQMILHPEWFYISELLEEIRIVFSHHLRNCGKSHVSLKNDKNEKDCRCKVYTDPVRLKQIITNLLYNAAQFTDSGSISFGCRIEKPNTIRFHVEDTGIGMPPDLLEPIFQPFRQGDPCNSRRHEGIGLGLPIARGLVQLMGSNMQVSSTPGKGSTFVFTITCDSIEECGCSTGQNFSFVGIVS